MISQCQTKYPLHALIPDEKKFTFGDFWIKLSKSIAIIYFLAFNQMIQIFSVGFLLPHGNTIMLSH